MARKSKAPQGIVTPEELRRELSKFATSHDSNAEDTITLEVIEPGVDTAHFRVSTKQPDARGARLSELMARGLQSKVLRVLKGNIVQTLDRAVRSSENWRINPGDTPFYADPTTKLTVSFNPKSDSALVLEQLRNLNPRTADVWRLVTALILEQWPATQLAPTPVWVQVTDLLDAMGYARQSAGGYRPAHIKAVADALATLENLWLVKLGDLKVSSVSPVTGKRQPTALRGQSSQRLVNILAREGVRTLDNEEYTMQWRIQAGEWINQFPRESAHVLKTLVELNAKSGPNIWAKALGMEIAYLCARRDSVLTMRVDELLERSGLIANVKGKGTGGNGDRARRYFEEALDILVKLGALQMWKYSDSSGVTGEANQAMRYRQWLEQHVTVSGAANHSLPISTAPIS